MSETITQEQFDSAIRNHLFVRSDCERIQRIARANDINCSLTEAETVWAWWSERYFSAGWLGISSDQQILEALESFCKSLAPNKQ